MGMAYRMNGEENAYMILVGDPERRRPLGRPIKIDLGEIGWDGVDWIDMAQDRDQLGGWGGLL
jgi:hypothetical protein